jgi:hypothetical protein
MQVDVAVKRPHSCKRVHEGCMDPGGGEAADGEAFSTSAKQEDMRCSAAALVVSKTLQRSQQHRAVQEILASGRHTSCFMFKPHYSLKL